MFSERRSEDVNSVCIASSEVRLGERCDLLRHIVNTPGGRGRVQELHSVPAKLRVPHRIPQHGDVPHTFAACDSRYWFRC